MTVLCLEHVVQQDELGDGQRLAALPRLNGAESLGTIEAGKRSEPLAIAQLILLYHMFQAQNSH